MRQGVNGPQCAHFLEDSGGQCEPLGTDSEDDHGIRIACGCVAFRADLPGSLREVGGIDLTIEQRRRSGRIDGTIAAVDGLREFAAGAVAPDSDMVPAIVQFHQAAFSELRRARSRKACAAVASPRLAVSSE